MPKLDMSKSEPLNAQPRLDLSKSTPVQQVLPMRGPEDTGIDKGAALRGTAQGFTSGFADEEIAGAKAFWELAKREPGKAIKTILTGMVSPTAGLIEAGKVAATDGKFHEDYVTERDYQRAIDAAAQERAPKSFMGGEVAGSLASAAIPGSGALSAAKGAGFGTRAVTGAISGLVSGGVSGVGYSEAEDLQGQTVEGLAGAGAGAVLGGAGESVLPIAKAAAKPFAKAAGKTAEKLGNVLKTSSPAFIKRASETLDASRLSLTGKEIEDLGEKGLTELIETARGLRNADAWGAKRLIHGQVIAEDAKSLVPGVFDPKFHKRLAEELKERGKAIARYRESGSQLGNPDVDKVIKEVTNYIDSNLNTAIDPGRQRFTKRLLGQLEKAKANNSFTLSTLKNLKDQLDNRSGWESARLTPTHEDAQKMRHILNSAENEVFASQGDTKTFSGMKEQYSKLKDLEYFVNKEAARRRAGFAGEIGNILVPAALGGAAGTLFDDSLGGAGISSGALAGLVFTQGGRKLGGRVFAQAGRKAITAHEDVGKALLKVAPILSEVYDQGGAGAVRAMHNLLIDTNEEYKAAVKQLSTDPNKAMQGTTGGRAVTKPVRPPT